MNQPTFSIVGKSAIDGSVDICATPSAVEHGNVQFYFVVESGGRHV